MATRTWIGAALDVPHVLAADVTAYDAATVYLVTVNTKAVRVSGAGNATATASALAAAWGGQTAPEFREATASANGTVLTLTGGTAGKPLAVASGVSGGTGTFGAFGNGTTPSGQSWWNVAANWKEGAVPADGDDVMIDGGPSILYGLSQAAVTLGSLRIGPNFPASSEIGLPDNTQPNSPGSGYPEYRLTRLTLGAGNVSIDTASRRIRLDLTSDATTVIVEGTGQAQVAGENALDLIAGNATQAGVVYVSKGSVGLCVTNAGNVADLNVSFRTSPASDAIVKCGRALTLANLDQSGGDVTLENGVATATKSAGTLTVAAGDVGTLNNNGGTVYHDGAGNFTAVNNYGTFERRGLRGSIIGTLTIFAKSRTSDRNGTVTWTNPVALSGCRLPSSPEDRGDDVAYFDGGRDRTLTVA